MRASASEVVAGVRSQRGDRSWGKNKMWKIE
jgi:hypothetical protein